jgi:3-hydroxyacyl-CoA dehydrogenase
MTPENFKVKKVAVLGAGVMGAQIAAHMINSGVEVVLFDLPSPNKDKKDGDKNAVVNKAIANLQKLEPSPICSKSKLSYIQPANYDEHLALLKDCQLIVEAIAERMDWKKELYAKITPHLTENCVIATNTSGLSIQTLSECIPAHLQSQFCGIHFFNPPRYMNLVEIIPCPKTNAKLLNALETFVVSTLGKGVIRTKDTPAFVANRVGVFSMLAVIHHAERLNMPLDTVDALTGTNIGRAKSATFRTADVVGLDTLAHVAKNLHDTLKNDPWNKFYKLPEWINGLIEKGHLGQKTAQGCYKKIGKEIHVFDLSLKNYRPSKPEIHPEVESILKIKNPEEKFNALIQSKNPQAEFLWSIFRDVFHFVAYHAESICHSVRDIDLALRWGFGWSAGPFETWQMAGWENIKKNIELGIKANTTLTQAPLPSWVGEQKNVYSAFLSYSPLEKKQIKPSSLDVYSRQIFPETLAQEKHSYGETCYENDGVRLWHTGDNIGILSFKSKMNTVGKEVLEGVNNALLEAEKHFKAMVVWQTQTPAAPFSFGANLSQVIEQLQKKDYAPVETMMKKFQETSLALRYSSIPVVAAVSGMALGGGCEFLMHCDKVVAASESYIGLVEGGVGLIPGGGGCKEFALRAHTLNCGGNVFDFVKDFFYNMATAQVSKSAENAKELGYLKQSDTVVMNIHEILYVAKKESENLANAGYRPPLKPKNIVVAGKGGIATCQALLTNMLEGKFISAHDFTVASAMAYAICGGDVETNSTVNEEWLLKCEQKVFFELLRNQKTVDRIEAMLKTGKPLRN